MFLKVLKVWNNFHWMILTVMGKVIKIFQPKMINKAHRDSLINKLSQETFANNDYGFQRFCDITLENLNKNAPFKIKYV